MRFHLWFFKPHLFLRNCTRMSTLLGERKGLRFQKIQIRATEKPSRNSVTDRRNRHISQLRHLRRHHPSLQLTIRSSFPQNFFSNKVPRILFAPYNSSSPNLFFPSFPNLLTRHLVLYIFLASSYLASSSTSHTSMLVCFRTPLCSMLRFLALVFLESQLFFRLRLVLFTILPLFYQAVDTGRPLLPCSIVSALASVMSPSSSIAPAFAN